MNRRIADALDLKHSPVAIISTDAKPERAAQFKEGSFGCVASMLQAATKGRTVVFDRKTSGCPGGGTGLGFGNCYAGFPIDRLLSTGGKAELGSGKIAKELLSYTVPYRMYIEMESSADDSFLTTRKWQKLRERW